MTLKTFLIAALATLAGFVVQELNLLAPIERSFLDTQTRWLEKEVPTDAALVEIDARSLSEIGTWPWPRRVHADVIDALVAAGAARIVIDIDFSSVSNPQDDARLEAAIKAAKGRVFLPSFWQRTSATADSMILSRPMGRIRSEVRTGSVNLAPAADGRIREVIDLTPPGASRSNPPLSEVLNPGKWGEDRYRLIDYRISPRSFPALSYAQLIHDPAAAQAFRGLTVFVGATALELGDLVTVPVHGPLPGVLVQALAYETIRAHALREMPYAWMLAALLLTGIATALLAARVRWQRLPMLGVAGVAIVLLAASTAYVFADIWWTAMPVALVVLAVVLGTVLSRLKFESLRALAYSLKSRRQEALLREVVSQSADALLTLDAEGRIISANPATESLLGKDAGSLVGRLLGEVTPQVAVLLTGAGPVAMTSEFTMTLRKGIEFPVEATIATIRVDSEHITTVKLRDISLQRNREKELRHHATHDALTGLPNRVYLQEKLKEVLERSPGIAQGVLVLLDLDGFKEVNDTLGHSVGDLVLTEIGKRLRQQMPQGAFVARLGGDEFAVLLEWQDELTPIEEFCDSLLLTSREPISVRGVPISLGMSAGIARWPLHAQQGEALLQKADVALYAAKRRHTTIEFYDPTADNNTPRRLEMLTLLRGAVRKEELHLVFQPKVDLQTGRTSSVEALCRWVSPELGPVSPGEFMPLAEASEIIMPLTRWTLQQALADCRQWRAAGHAIGVAVNLSARHLQDSLLPQMVDELLQESGLPAEVLELEITESAIMSDPARAYSILSALRALGVKLSIDDFGTGYSSLAYLHRLQVDRLKIDKSFIDDMLTSEGSRVIVNSTIHLGHALGLQVIAEGIENAAQRDALTAMGCDFGQGFLYSKGLKPPELLAWLANASAEPAGSTVLQHSMRDAAREPQQGSAHPQAESGSEKMHATLLVSNQAPIVARENQALRQMGRTAGSSFISSPGEIR